LRIKYFIDRCAAAALIIVLAPLMAVVGTLVWLNDRGPVFFRQYRIGLNGKPFSIWKFRTMVQNADQLLDDKGQVTSAMRITRVGRFLRKTSLDELPQLFNIVRGQMSFIGPRPGLPEHYTRYSSEQRRRYSVRPGVTGLAQVSGRNSLPWSERIRFDLQYIDGYSLLLDVKILLRTLWVVLTGHGIVLDRNPQQVDDLGPPRNEP
jgi:lipopolysaccharide/colanic/teichoic acid biosynthesis glycosyltransferase